MKRRNFTWLALLWLGLGPMVWADPTVNQSAGFYYDAFDTQLGVEDHTQVNINTAAPSYVSLSAGSSSGWLISRPIAPSTLQRWLSLDIDKTGTASNGDRIDLYLLDAVGNTLQSLAPTGVGPESFANILLGNTTSPLRVQAYLRRTGSGNGPALRSWKVSWLPKPDLQLSLTAQTAEDPLGVTVTASYQVSYTATCFVNNVDATNAMIAVTCSALDYYNTDMISFNRATPSPNQNVNKTLTWNLGNLAAGTSHSVSFLVDVPWGTIAGANSSTHINGRPIALLAQLTTQQTGGQVLFSSPEGNTLVGASYGRATLTYVKSAPRVYANTTAGQWPNVYAIPGKPYNIILRIENLQGSCSVPPTTCPNGEVLHHVVATMDVPAGTNYLGSGLFFNPPYTNYGYVPNFAGNTGFTSSRVGNTVTWTIDRMGLHYWWTCSRDRGVYLYLQVMPTGIVPGSFTINPATVTSDQNLGTAAVTTPAKVVNLVLESTVDADPLNYTYFAGEVRQPTVFTCDTLPPFRMVTNLVNKPLAAYVVEKVPDNTYLKFYDPYCYFTTVNGTLLPAGNSVPSYYSATVTASNLPDPPSPSSVIWHVNDTAKNFGTIRYLLTDLGLANYNLMSQHDALYREYYIVNSAAPFGGQVVEDIKLFAKTTPSSAMAKTFTTTHTIAPDTTPPRCSISLAVSGGNPIEAGRSTYISSYNSGYGRNAYLYGILTPGLELDPVSTTTTFPLAQNSCDPPHTCWIEYATTPGLYPFDRQTAERANWSRVQPLDVAKITGIRWVLGNIIDTAWASNVIFGPSMGIKAKLGWADGSNVVQRQHFVCDGTTAPLFDGGVTININSHVAMSLQKALDTSVLPTGRIRYLLTSNNVGTMDEDLTEVWDQVPEHALFDSAQAPAGVTLLYSNATSPTRPTSGWTTTSGLDTTWLKWDLSRSPVNTPWSVTLTVKPMAGLAPNETIENKAYLWSLHGTTLTSSPIDVINAPDFSNLAFTNLSVSPVGDVRSGTLMTYRIKYQNTGLEDATNVTMQCGLSDKLDASTLKFIAGLTGSYDSGTRTIRWNLGDLNISVANELAFQVRTTSGVSPGGTIDEHAELRSNETPSVSTNTVSNHFVTEIYGFQVTPDPNLTGDPAAYRVQMHLGTEGALAAGQTLTLEFPSTMSLPAELKAGEVTVNGVATHSSGVRSGQRMIITLPTALPNSSSVDLLIKVGAGLVNPARGNYTLKVNTSTEPVWKSAEFSILVRIEDQQLLAAPNPARTDRVRFFFNLEGPGTVLITVYNVMGEKVADITENKPGGKGQSSDWHVNKVGNGIYLCRMRVKYQDGREVFFPVKKVVISRN